MSWWIYRFTVCSTFPSFWRPVSVWCWRSRCSFLLDGNTLARLLSSRFHVVPCSPLYLLSFEIAAPFLKCRKLVWVLGFLPSKYIAYRTHCSIIFWVALLYNKYCRNMYPNTKFGLHSLKILFKKAGGNGRFKSRPVRLYFVISWSDIVSFSTLRTTSPMLTPPCDTTR